MAGQAHAEKGHGGGGKPSRPGPFKRFQQGFDHRFERFRRGYRDLLAEVTGASGRFIAVFMGLTLASLLLIPFLGRDFFPEIRSGEIDLHMRARIGTRIEEAGKLAVLVNQEVRKALPPGQVKGIVNNCGLPISGIAEVYSASGTIGPQDCDMTISLARDDSPVQDYRKTLRRVLSSKFPGTNFTFLPGDITAKILNFGLPAPIDIQVVGRDQDANFEYAKKVLARISKIPGIADPNIYQAPNAPTLRIAASRSFASGIGLTEADVANNALAALSGSGQAAPSYWLDTKNGVSYLINVQTPQPQLDTMNDLETLPIDAGNGDPSGRGVQLLGGLAQISQTGMPQIVSHYSITPTIDIYASVEGRDLGAVSDAIQQVLQETAGEVPSSSHVEVRGQAVTMGTAYTQLIGGLLFAVMLVYLVIVVNFQSWLDPFIIITALAVAGGTAAWGVWDRHSTVAGLGKTADAASVPKVAVVSPPHGPASRNLTLPGQMQAWYQAPIYAQVTGYATKWDKDYGAAVKKGDVLAAIETPDLDQQLQQARAELDVAKSKAALARTTAQRWQKLAGTQAVSQEAVDVNAANARSAQAVVQATQFNVARFEAQEAFKQVVAPFDGVVTSRSTDVGAFVNAAGGTAQQKGGTQELFTVADVHEMRVFVSVPQDYSASIKPGLAASLTLPQFPGQTFKAHIITNAKSFDVNARTVLTELTIPNPDGNFWPGAYAEVRFEVPTGPRVLVIPEQALLFRAQGLQAALVGSDNRGYLQTIKLGLNLGGTVQVVDGLKPGDRVISNPSDGLLEGQQVDVVSAQKAPGNEPVASNDPAQPAGQ